MYYQGENIQVNVISDSITDLKGKNFKLLFYPHCTKDDMEKTIIIDKSENIQTDKDNDKTIFVFNIPYTTTKDMLVGDYDLEVLIEYNENDFRSIFKKSYAFSINHSNSKNIE
jgi:hypothetical protein